MNALLIIVIGFNLLFIYLLWQNRQKGKKAGDDQETIAFRDNVSKLITDFNRVANTNINILEDKTEDLKNVLTMADERILKLNNLLVDLSITQQRGEKRVMEEAAPQPPHEEAASKPKKAAKKEPPLTQPPSYKHLSIEEKKERIYELMAAGFAMEDIARAVSMSQTEIQLILGLKDVG